MKNFFLCSEKTPSIDQKVAIDTLVDNVKKGKKIQTLMGVTGSGKTFSVANVINKLNMPTLIIVHNKTLAAQWYQEIREMFPSNAVRFYISIFDYYRPESYVPRTSTYIEKESVINKEIHKHRAHALESLVSRNDTIVISSVSCIFGTGSPSAYEENVISLSLNKKISIFELTDLLWQANYKSSDNLELKEGEFIVTSSILSVKMLLEPSRTVRISIVNDRIKSILEKIGDADFESVKKIKIFPTTTHSIKSSKWEKGIQSIKRELKKWVEHLVSEGKLEEAQRITERTNNDIAFMKEHYTCNGIENYSVHFSGKKRGETPYSLLDFFPKTFLTVIDESHQSIPQMSAMHKSTKERINKLVEFGYRLPSAHDNRPLKFDEALDRMDNIIYVSATPSDRETLDSSDVVEQIIRPTGLLDPEIEVRSRDSQVDDCLREINAHPSGKFLIITVTKRMAENLDRYLKSKQIKSKYIHSELTSHERCMVINELRTGKVDVIIGINLLREGLDIPEVTRVFVFDADQEGFLRSTSSLLQICGRAARNAEGKVIFYANRVTCSMKAAIDESSRRRKIQIAHNEKYGITPVTTYRKIEDVNNIPGKSTVSLDSKSEIDRLKKEMVLAASEHRYSDAIKLRERIALLKGNKRRSK